MARCERSDWELVSTAAFAANCANLEVWPSWVDSPARKTLLSLRSPTPMSPSETINACAALKELCGKLNDPAPSVVWAGGVHAALGWSKRPAPSDRILTHGPRGVVHSGYAVFAVRYR